MGRAARLARAVVDALVPPRCLACADILNEPVDDDVRGLCAVCAEQLEAPVGASPGLWVLAGPLRDVVYRAKYGPDPGAAVGLAALCAAGVARARAADLGDVGIVTFVPASRRRAAARGFDVPALLADAVARTLGVPWGAVLEATRHDLSLAASSTKAERAGLVAGRFAVRRRWRGRLDGVVVLVVDDVATTGATLAEASEVLTAAGASVRTLTLAQTPAPGDTAFDL